MTSMQLQVKFKRTLAMIAIQFDPFARYRRARATPEFDNGKQ
jgi:hypothetical protein